MPTAVQAIHACAVKFPDVATAVIHLLMDFLGDTNTASALDVVFFVRCADLIRLAGSWCFWGATSSDVLFWLGEYQAAARALDAQLHLPACAACHLMSGRVDVPPAVAPTAASYVRTAATAGRSWRPTRS